MSRISVVMNDSDHFLMANCSWLTSGTRVQKLGFLGGDILKRKKRGKTRKKRVKHSGTPWRMTGQLLN